MMVTFWYGPPRPGDLATSSMSVLDHQTDRGNSECVLRTSYLAQSQGVLSVPFTEAQLCTRSTAQGKQVSRCLGQGKIA